MPDSKASSPEVDDDGSNVEGDDQKASSSSKRACDYCHRMKMKCINKENPPCNRCRSSGQPCTFNGPRKTKATKVEDRLKLVEAQMSTFQSSLSELIALQRASLPGASRPVPTPPPSASLPAQPPIPPGLGGYMGTIEPHHLHQSVHFPPPPSMNMPFQRQPPAQPSFSPRYETLFMPSPQTMSEQMSQRQMSSSTYNGPGISPQATRGPQMPQFPAPPQQSRPPLSASQSRWSEAEQRREPTPHRPGSRGRSNMNGTNGDSADAVPGSGVASDDEDDPDEVPSATSGPWNSMLSLVEAARLKADNHESKEDEVKPMKDTRPSRPFNYDVGGPAKKRRRSELEDGDKGGVMYEKGTHKHAFRDPVELGMLSNERGKQLYDQFMQNCLFYVPILDPARDTYESICIRSPFLATATMLVGIKGEDGPTKSDLQCKLQEHAEKIAMSTLFTPIARIEVIQALTLMAAWSDSLYRPAGHALRIAMEMGLWRCLGYLAQNGMGKGRTVAETEEERPLVAGARVWLTLYMLEGQHAINSGRPFTLSAESLKDARAFLSHPLTVPTDSRLVNFSELQMVRMGLHQPYSLITNAGNMPDLDQKIKRANEQFHEWHVYWDGYYARLGYPEDAMFRVTLLTMLAGSRLYCNAIILNGVRSRRDIALLSEERHGFILRAIKDAQLLMETAFRGNKGHEYVDRFRWANFFTHINFAFFARFLIRMSSLTPEAVDVRQVGRDVERVALLLTKVPGFQFAQLLRDVLSRARKRHVLPPASKPGSPAGGSAPLPGLLGGGLTALAPTPSASSLAGIMNNQSPTQHPYGNGNLGQTGVSPHNGSDSAFSGALVGLPELDFGLADQLFTDPTFGFGFGGQDGTMANTSDATGMGFDAWYAFPPLDDSILGAQGQGHHTQQQQQSTGGQMRSPHGGFQGQMGGGGNGQIGRSGTWW